MIEKPQAYKDAIVADSRRMHLKIIIDLISPDIEYTGYDSQSIMYLDEFDVDKMHEKSNDLIEDRVTTLELNKWVLDGKTSFDTQYAGNYTSNGIVDQEVQWFELTFSNCSVLQAFSVNFSKNVTNGVPKNFVIELKSGSSTVFSETVVNNKATEYSFSEFLVYNPTSVKITVTEMSIPYRRLRLHSFVLGIYEEWSEDDIGSLSIKHQGDFSCTSLPYGTCEMGVDNSNRRFEPRNKQGLFSSIEERQAVPVFIGIELENGTVDYTQTGVFYQHSGGWKTSDNGLLMNWELVDILGLLSERDYTPTILFGTLEEWATDVVSQLGPAFAERITVDPNYANLPVTIQNIEDLNGMSCGDMILNICMATGTWARADSETGYLAIEPLWEQGNYITLDNIVAYPTMSANDDVSLVVFTLSDDTEVVVSGNNSASDKSINIKNPFLHTREQAISCARNILTMYGGNAVEIVGRGDMSSEIGDVDSIQLNESVATSARRIKQEFEFTNGVMVNLVSNFVQPDGGFLYRDSVLITENGEWTAPAGVTTLRVVIGGGGSGGTNGTNGNYSEAGEDGEDGVGGKILVQTITINEGQTFSISIGAGGGTGQDGSPTLFGTYSSENGRVYSPSFTDVSSGNTYGRTGVEVPLPGSSDGGKRGLGGAKGNRHTAKYVVSNPDGTVTVRTKTVIDNRPGTGGTGTPGASGFVLIYYDKTS